MISYFSWDFHGFKHKFEFQFLQAIFPRELSGFFSSE